MRVDDVDAMPPDGVPQAADKARPEAAAKGDRLDNDPGSLRPLEGTAVRRGGEHHVVAVARLPRHRVQGAVLETARGQALYRMKNAHRPPSARLAPYAKLQCRMLRN